MCGIRVKVEDLDPDTYLMCTECGMSFGLESAYALHCAKHEIRCGVCDHV